MKKSIQNERPNYISKLVVFTVILSVCFLSVGYSAFSNTNTIESILAYVRPVASARITDLLISNTANGGVSNSENYAKDQINGSISLPNANSTVTYEVDVTVFLSSEMKLTSITGLDSNLEYTISGYNMGDIICDSHDECNLGATKTMQITIGYKNGVNNSGTTTHPVVLNFNFEVANVVAKIGNTRYQTLQAAVNAVPNDGTETTINVLKDTSESVTVNAGKNITLNLNGNTVSNSGNTNVIINNGTIRMSNGTIRTSVAQGAINNNSGATFIMTGGSVIGSGRQAIYNDGGRLEISGNAVLRTTSSERAAVQNLNSGTLIITGGTIESTRFSGVKNAATMTIGTKDGNVSTTSPSITGKPYGVESSTNFNFYDGIVKGETLAFDNESKIVDKETGKLVVHSGSITYDGAYLGDTGYLVTFNANGGSVSPTSRLVVPGAMVGTLPKPTYSGYVFDGWFDSPSNGISVTSNSVINAATTIYAYWTDPNAMVAEINGNYYLTLEEAIAAVPNNTQTTISLLKNYIVPNKLTFDNTKKITFDLGGNILRNGKVDMPVFENLGGTIVIQNGSIISNGSQGAVNNRRSGGSLTLNNLSVTASGTRQAVYNENGTTYINNCTLENYTNERAAVHNLSNGKIYITGGSITAHNYSGIYNASGTVTLGSKDGNITSVPTVTGSIYGVQNSATFNFYDGLIKGIDGAISGNVSDSDGTVTNGTDGNYTTAYLE